jgi:hypothetical protein
MMFETAEAALNGPMNVKPPGQLIVPIRGHYGTIDFVTRFACDGQNWGLG